MSLAVTQYLPFKRRTPHIQVPALLKLKQIPLIYVLTYLVVMLYQQTYLSFLLSKAQTFLTACYAQETVCISRKVV